MPPKLRRRHVILINKGFFQLCVVDSEVESIRSFLFDQFDNILFFLFLEESLSLKVHRASVLVEQILILVEFALRQEVVLEGQLSVVHRKPFLRLHRNRSELHLTCTDQDCLDRPQPEVVVRAKL